MKNTLLTLHLHCKENRLQGRYISYSDIKNLVKEYASIFEVSYVGVSVLGTKIPMLKLGHGEQKILAWSQMHGNESTTTKAVFDLLSFLSQKDSHQDLIQHFLDSNTLYVLPMLNPDGAAAYTRTNANEVDLNRDAQDASQPESKLLLSLFKNLKPSLCLNLHDQRSIYGLPSGNPAIVSFLAPAADDARTITAARATAMKYIEQINGMLQHVIPGCVGRYDDSFNINCVGDTFTKAGVPTILFEAGHHRNDYNRELSRAYVFLGLLQVLQLMEPLDSALMPYLKIPQNKKNYCDVLLKNVKLMSSQVVDIAIQFEEQINEKKISFIPFVKEIETSLIGHRIIDCGGDEVLFDGLKIVQMGTVFDKLYISSNKTTVSLKIP